ncbi:DHHC zinc finger protein (macronuclear) [Tetrahymena thermophila SB210]|uniref:Palmitoyltransferase n=1 Tax=Tetrahymena thermophila (strain SB210) TaxID=312017 RepID=I7M3B4_TETTS|nr:DHHC zinc finger protein [Tetrahymena thermophila SB210]EAS02821.2 DHHC zinc finger protein [Tetrahymena thermophila SB210]|eukprot:XP_001023066.2 DHHC zinc finger protein [Tetrahymena thermophila SB210]
MRRFLKKIIQKNQDFEKQRANQKKLEKKIACSKILDDNYNIEILYLYQLWSGANKFFCQGRVITGPKYKPFLIAILLILIPTIMVIVFFQEHRLIVIILASVVFFFKFKASFNDPGIVDRLNNTFQDDEEIKMIPSKSYSTQLHGVYINDTNGHLQQYRLCETCQIYKNKNMKHCRTCDNCVSQFDHHCIWLNNCIGKRNYTDFIMYLIFLQSLIAYTIYLCIQYIIDETNLIATSQFITRSIALNKVLSHQPLSIILIIYGTIFLFLVSTLFFFHVYLLFKSLTTVEFTKIQKGVKNYFSLSLIETFKQKFSLFNNSSSLDFRKKIIIKTKKEPKQNTQVSNNLVQAATFRQQSQSQDNKNEINYCSKSKETPQPVMLEQSLALNINANQSQIELQGKKQDDQQDDNVQNGNTEQFQTIYINQKNQLKKIKLPSIGVRKLNKNQSQFKYSNFSKNQKHNQSLKQLSEIQGSENYIKNFIEGSGICQTNLINQKNQQNLPSPSDANKASQQQLNQEDIEASNINNNEISIQKSQIYEENDAVQISYYSDTIYN